MTVPLRFDCKVFPFCSDKDGKKLDLKTDEYKELLPLVTSQSYSSYLKND